MAYAGVCDEIPSVTELDRVCERIGREIAVDERWTCSQTFNREPQHEVFGTVGAVKSHHLSWLDVEVFQ